MVEKVRRSMMSRRYFFPFLIIFLVVILSGCNGEDTATIKTPDGEPVEPVGLSIKFIEGYPPSRVRGYTPFDMYLDVRNLGGHTIKPKGLTLTLDSPDFETRSDEKWTNLDAIESKKIGALTVDNFKEFTYSGLLYPGAETSGDIGISACYRYQTNASGMLCFKPNPDEFSEVCTEAGNKLRIHTKAPIYVSFVEQKIFTDGVELRITVTNEGNGVVYDIGKGCIEKLDKDYVFLKALYIGDETKKDSDHTLTCGSATDRLKRLSDGKVTFKCDLIVPTATVVEKPFKIILDYDYAVRLSRTVEVFSEEH